MAGKFKLLVRQTWILKEIFRSKVSLLNLFLFFSTLSAFSQTINDFKEIWVKESREFLRNNQKPLPYLQSGFHQFSREQDNVLTEALELAWEKFPVIQGTPIPKSKKFEQTPQFDFEETSYHNPHFLPCYISENLEDAAESEFSNLPRIRKPEYSSSNPVRLSFKFYGNNISVTYDKLLSIPVNQPVSKEIVSEFWAKFLVANSNHLMNQLVEYRDRLGLNEWGYFLLVKSCSVALYPKDESGSNLLSWALMLRSGFNVKIGYNQLGSSVLYTSASKINGIPWVKIDESEYYIDKPISSFSVTSYHADHPGAMGSIHLKINHSVNFSGDIETKKIQFPWDKKIYEFNIKYNPEVIQYLENYPQTDTEVYFNAPFSFLAGESLLKQFRPILAGMKKVEGAAFLQQFVQKNFGYRPYNDIFGYDRFMFPEELLFKDESNDKGKALLYAWMITHLLNERAALVEFPGFYSVAISLGQPLDGDNFLIKGKSYTIADPTFNNAPIGLIMKEFYQIKPLIRPLISANETEALQNRIWKLAMAFGAERSGSGNDFLIDKSRNSYITGYFREKKANNSSTVPAPFIARFDENNELVWMEKFTSKGRAFGLELKQVDENEFYLAGTFRGDLECNGKKIHAEPSDPDLFFAQFNRLGEIEWITKSGLDELDEDTRLFYVVKFTRSGDIQSVQLANEDERNGIAGFQQANNEGLCYVASRFQTTGLDRASEESTPKTTTLLKQNLNRMRQLGIDQTTAYIASLLNSLINSGNQLTGTDLGNFKQEKGPFPNASLTISPETTQRIKLIKNNSGIVETYTSDLKPFKILSFSISSGSHVKLIPFENNDIKIKVIDGVDYESGAIRAKVNSVIIDLSIGSLVLDLGTDHQIVTKNLKLRN